MIPPWKGSTTEWLNWEQGSRAEHKDSSGPPTDTITHRAAAGSVATFSETANQLHCSLWNSYIPERLYSRSEDFGSSLRDSTELLLLQGSFRLQPLLEMPGKLMKFPNTQLVPCFGLKVQGKFRKDISYPEEIFETGKMKKFKSTMRWIFFVFFFS